LLRPTCSLNEDAETGSGWRIGSAAAALLQHPGCFPSCLSFGCSGLQYLRKAALYTKRTCQQESLLTFTGKTVIKMNGTTPIARLLCAGPRRDGAAPDLLVTFCLSTEAGAGGQQGKR